MEIIKLVDKSKAWVGKDGTPHESTTTFFLQYEIEGNPRYIAIKPHFLDSKRDWASLNAIAKVQIKEKKN